MLNAQQIHYVGIGKDVIDGVRNFDAQFLELTRHQCARTDEGNARAKFHETENVRACDSAEENVANNQDVQPGDFSTPLADGVKIKKRLGRMLVCAVACIDYTCFDSLGEKLRRARGAMSQNKNISMQRFEIARGIFKGLAL